MSSSILLERSLSLGGRALRLIPADRSLTIPFGLNRGYRWVRGAANAPEWLGIYEFAKQRALRRLVRPGTIVCDIGANAGFYSLALSRLAGAKGRVIAFEPLRRNIEKIERHLALNQIRNIELHQCALSDVTGFVHFEEGDSDFTGRISDETNSIKVQSIRLDDFLREHSLGDPALLKIDVEGAEARVLSGAANLIRRARPTLFVALHGAEQRHACFDLLRGANYQITNLAGVTLTGSTQLPDEIVAYA